MAEQERASIPVCFLASNAQLGGTELFLESLLEALGHEWIEEVLLLGQGPFGDRLESNGVRVRTVPSRRRTGLLLAALRVRRLLAGRRPRLIHANGVNAALVAVLATVGMRCPVVWHKQDCARDGWIARWIARRCRLVVGVSSTVLKTLAGLSVDTVVVHNAIPRYEVDRGEAREALVQSLGASPGSRLVAQVGRLAPGKGQLELLEIAPRLRRRVPQLRLVFVGAADPSQPEYEELLRQRVRELGLKDCVSFMGYCEDAVQITAGCDVLAAPSLPDPASGWREGFPFAPLEAMAVGTPVAGYAEPALVEELGPCAELAPSGDRDRLCEAIESLITDEDGGRRLRECGLHRVRSYELPEATARMKQIFHRALV